MSAVLTSSANTTESPPFPVHRFSVEEYHRLCDVGLLDEDAPVELLEGWIVPKRPHSPLHDAVVQATHELLARALPHAWKTRVQSAIVTADSEPEPDVAVVKGPGSRYRDHHPSTGEILLIVEVADSSLQKERRKAGVYCSIEVPTYRIVNLQDHSIEVRQESDVIGRASRNLRTFREGETINIAQGDKVLATIAVTDVLG